MRLLLVWIPLITVEVSVFGKLSDEKYKTEKNANVSLFTVFEEKPDILNQTALDETKVLKYWRHAANNSFNSSYSLKSNSKSSFDEEYPPVTSSRITTTRSYNRSIATITYKISERRHTGVRIHIYDSNEHELVGLFTKNSTIIIEDLPLLSNLTARFYVGYSKLRSFTFSNAFDQSFFTDFGDIEKPEILNITALDETNVLIYWRHSTEESFDFTYGLKINDELVFDIGQNDKNYHIIDKLTADTLYRVILTVRLNAQLVTSSDASLVRTLPQGALIPHLIPGKVCGNYLKLNWTVFLPEDPSFCRMKVTTLSNGRVVTYSEIDPTEMTMDFGVEFFQTYHISAELTCRYMDDVFLYRRSDTVDVFTVLNPSAFDHYFAYGIREDGFSIKYVVNSRQEPFITAYKLKWFKAEDGGGDESIGGTHQTSYSVKRCDIFTLYNVSVVPYILYNNETIWGEPNNLLVKTRHPIPPAASQVKVVQKKYSPVVLVEWEAPKYEYTPLQYEVTGRCGNTKVSRVTNQTSLDIIFGFLKPNTQCTISIQCMATADGDSRRSESIKTNFIFDNFDAPSLKSIESDEDNVYTIKLEPPQRSQVLNFYYQLEDANSDYKHDNSHKTETFVLKYSSKYETHEMKARVCFSELCSEDLLFSFTTKTGAPGPVMNFSVDSILQTKIRLSWQKPLETNGPIDGYQVYIQSGQQSGMYTVMGNETHFEYDTKLEYTLFQASIRALNLNRYNITHIQVGESRTLVGRSEGKAPPPPQSISVRSSNAGLTLYWTHPHPSQLPVCCYLVETKEENANPSVEFQELVTAQEFLLKDLKAYTNYEIYVSSCVQQDPSQCGEEIKFEVLTEVSNPSAPEIVSVQSTKNRITIKWKKPNISNGPIDGYQIACIETSKEKSPTDWETYNSSFLEATIPYLKEHVEYTVYLKAFNIDSNYNALYSPASIDSIFTA